MKQAFIIAALALGGCAVTPAGLASTEVKRTIASAKPAKDFALCVAENLPDAEMRDDGNRYWVVFKIFDIPRIRWDFTPSGTGSIAETRSTAIGNSGAREAQACA